MKFSLTSLFLLLGLSSFAQTFSFDDLFALKYKDSDDAINILEDKGFEISGFEDDHMYFSCTDCEEGKMEAIKIVFETEKENGPNILQSMVIEYALQDKDEFKNLRESFKSSDRVKKLEKMSATIEPKNEEFTSAVEKSTYRCEINSKKEFFSFARFIPANAIYKEADIQAKFGYSVTLQ